MNNLIWLVGAVVIVLAILEFLRISLKETFLKAVPSSMARRCSRSG